MKAFIGFIGFVIAVAVLLSAAFSVTEGHTAIVSSFGRVVGVEQQPGLHFKWPLIASVIIVDQRSQLLTTVPVRASTADQKELSVDFFVIGQISDAQAFVRSTGGCAQFALARLSPLAAEVLRAAMKDHTLPELIRDSHRAMLKDPIQKMNAQLRALGIHVLDLRLGQINLPPESGLMSDVLQRMLSQRLQDAARLRASGEEEAVKLRVQADQEAAVIIANAQRDGQLLMGQGEADAAQIYARAAALDPAFYGFYRSLEAYRHAMSAGDAVILLRRDDPFLRAFKLEN